VSTTCEHLAALEMDLRATGVRIQSDGLSWWDERTPGWMYFSMYLVPDRVRAQYGLPEFVEYSAWDGHVAGQEAGFECKRCRSAIMGVHPAYRAQHPTFPGAV
jgi:hypothetical protein